MAVRKKSPETKPHYHHGDLRRALIDASLALIAQEGFRALTLREVARRAGVTHAAPYRHFADKEALLAAVAEEGFRTMASQMRERMAQASGHVEQLCACGTAYVLFAVRNPSHFRVMFGPHFSHPLDHSRVDAGDDNAFGLLLRGLVECQRVGLAREGDPLQLALTAWSLVHGLASLLVDGMLQPPDTGVEKLALFQTRLLFEGILRSPHSG